MEKLYFDHCVEVPRPAVDCYDPLDDGQRGHPPYPLSNIRKIKAMDPEKYVLADVKPVILTDEALTPNTPPRLTQKAIGKYLSTTDLELDNYPPKPAVAEISARILERYTLQDKAYWVDKPGLNDYELHRMIDDYKLRSYPVPTISQAVFPRPYLYEYDCVTFNKRRQCAVVGKGFEESAARAGGQKNSHDASSKSPRKVPEPTIECCLDQAPFWWKGAKNDSNMNPQKVAYPTNKGLKTCEACIHVPPYKRCGLKIKKQIADSPDTPKPGNPFFCQICKGTKMPYTPFEFKLLENETTQRWRPYPDYHAHLTDEQIQSQMRDVGRPFRNEALLWYNKKFPSTRYDLLRRTFSV